jgi:hypothetical protein
MSNLSSLDRILRIIIGLALLAVPFVLGWPTIALTISAIVGVVLLATAAISFCPIYALLGLSSKQGRLGKN